MVRDVVVVQTTRAGWGRKVEARGEPGMVQALHGMLKLLRNPRACGVVAILTISQCAMHHMMVSISLPAAIQAPTPNGAA